MPDFAHLDPEARKALFSSPGQRKRMISAEVYSSFPAGDAALNAILRLGDALPATAVSFIQLRGPPGTGKRAILDEAHRRLASSYPLERRSVRYVTDVSPTPSCFMHRLLIAGEVPHIWNGRAESQRGRVLSAFALQNVRVLLASKLHNAAPTAAAAKKYLPVLRAFCEEAKINAAFTSNRAPRELLEKDPDLAAATTEFVFSPWAVERWVLDAVRSAIRRFPLRHETTLDWRFLELLYSITAGLPGRIFPLLREAGCVAIETGEERLTLEMLEKAAGSRRAP